MLTKICVVSHIYHLRNRLRSRLRILGMAIVLAFMNIANPCQK
ncbi:hypothetical protein SARI_02514 [Salmonella enterica subsp. arizonae serovar 62:z4,z23:-]|uniref:Uncharacterized protein n=1 Tax=Salmonella arizonae (strain ATCC BAA-731 / CDC346-86 / RSK2980) TaxID=41514 RepID=A9MM51_SALAR|nr:hypothetical protein SARI_02514 [Salmonella enterica subsp. arizonae serovar 62:z4,z23:-]